MKKFKFCKFKEPSQEFEGLSEEQILAMKEMNEVRAAVKKATILNSDGELDIKRMKQSFFQEFYLMSGLASLRKLRRFNNQRDLFKNLTDRVIKENRSEEQQTTPEGETKLFEEEVILNYECDERWPICLYDFTFSHLFPSHLCMKTFDRVDTKNNHFKDNS